MLKSLSLALAVVVATPAAAQITIETSSATPAPAAVVKDGKDMNRVICEKQDQVGSRLSAKKVCKTALEWQIERTANRRTIEDVQRQGTSTGVPGGSI